VAETPPCIGGVINQHPIANGRGVKVQVYSRSFDPRGVQGLADRLDWLKWMGVDGVITHPTHLHDPANPDGPYAPMDHMRVQPEYGGEDGIQALNSLLRAAGVTPFGDLVANHADEQSDLVRRVFDDPARWADWFRLTRDPSGWRNKVQIFGLKNAIYEPELKLWRASTFYPNQWEFNADNPAVVAYVGRVADWMVGHLGYGALRLDAIAYTAGTRLTTRTGEHEPAGFALALAIRERLGALARPGQPRPLTLAEAGGTIEDIARWLKVSDLAYDFQWPVRLVHSLDLGDWGPIRAYRRRLPVVTGSWMRFLGSHDERQLRYYPEGRQELVERHGGPDGQYVCFGGNGLTLPVRRLVPSEAAFWLLLAKTILASGVPALFMSDIGGWGGDPTANALDPRDPNRCRVPWDASLSGAGWPEGDHPYPLDPAWRTTSVEQQMMDPNSTMAWVRRLVALRTSSAAFQTDEETELEHGNPALDIVLRTADRTPSVIVITNATGVPQETDIDLGPFWGSYLRRVALDGSGIGRGLVTHDPHRSPIQHRLHRVAVGPYAVQVLEIDR
jgi:glycosidase